MANYSMKFFKDKLGYANTYKKTEREQIEKTAMEFSRFMEFTQRVKQQFPYCTVILADTQREFQQWSRHGKDHNLTYKEKGQWLIFLYSNGKTLGEASIKMDETRLNILVPEIENVIGFNLIDRTIAA